MGADIPDSRVQLRSTPRSSKRQPAPKRHYARRRRLHPGAWTDWAPACPEGACAVETKTRGCDSGPNVEQARSRPSTLVGEACVAGTVVCVTAAAAPSMAIVHHRQPLCLEDDEVNAWLDPATPLADIEAILATGGAREPGVTLVRADEARA